MGPLRRPYRGSTGLSVLLFFFFFGGGGGGGGGVGVFEGFLGAFDGSGFGSGGEVKSLGLEDTGIELVWAVRVASELSM